MGNTRKPMGMQNRNNNSNGLENSRLTRLRIGNREWKSVPEGWEEREVDVDTGRLVSTNAPKLYSEENKLEASSSSSDEFEREYAMCEPTLPDRRFAFWMEMDTDTDTDMDKDDMELGDAKTAAASTKTILDTLITEESDQVGSKRSKEKRQRSDDRKDVAKRETKMAQNFLRRRGDSEGEHIIVCPKKMPEDKYICGFDVNPGSLKSRQKEVLASSHSPKSGLSQALERQWQLERDKEIKQRLEEEVDRVREEATRVQKRYAF